MCDGVDGHDRLWLAVSGLRFAKRCVGACFLVLSVLLWQAVSSSFLPVSLLPFPLLPFPSSLAPSLPTCLHRDPFLPLLRLAPLSFCPRTRVYV